MKDILGWKKECAYKRNIPFMPRMLVVIASLFIISGFVISQNLLAQNQTQIKIGENTQSIKSGKETREYLLYIPAGYDGKSPLPLVFLFHGANRTSKLMMVISDLGRVADEKKFIIAAPEGMYSIRGMKGWNTELDPDGVNDVELVKDLINEISSKVAIDKKKVYAAGFSFGAAMSSRLACDLSNVIAAIGPVGGLRFPVVCSPIRPVSVITFNGTRDYLNMYHSAEMSVSRWVEKNGCDSTPMTKKISEDVTQANYGGCKGNTEVVFFSIRDGGHTWPGSPIDDFFKDNGFGKLTKDINASNLIWSFFEKHPLP
jgi:polyhydroxybutyrate depolymerase